MFVFCIEYQADMVKCDWKTIKKNKMQTPDVFMLKCTEYKKWKKEELTL